jgi:hypothetical protein
VHKAFIRDVSDDACHKVTKLVTFDILNILKC